MKTLIARNQDHKGSMKIVLCRSSCCGPIDGAGETITTYASELYNAGYDASVLLMYSHPRERQYTDRLQRLGVSVSHVTDHPVNRALSFTRKAASYFFRLVPRAPHLLHGDAERFSHLLANYYFDRCRKQLRESRADVVHVLTADFATPIIIAAAHAEGLPVIYHELGTPCNPPAFAPYHQRLMQALPFCASIAALSPHLAALCREQYSIPDDKVTVLPLMVEDLSPGLPLRESSNGVTFGFAARFEALKGSLILADAFASLYHQFPSVRLRMAGAGSEEAKITARLREPGLQGYCDLPGPYTTFVQKRSFMQSLDVLVHPSLTEGTPNTIIEAMSLGLPIIASAVGGVPDLLARDIGVLVPPGDARALTEAMYHLAVNPKLRESMGRAARERYEQLFSPAKVLPLLLETYRRVAAGEQPVMAADRWSSRSAHPWDQLSESVFAS